MEITDRELSNLLERFFYRWANTTKEDYKDLDSVIDENSPTDKDFLEYSQLILGDIKKIKGKWII